ncbi:hypothetical protein FRB91_011420 [Serendipita sp. 411]|nr:hypothetical protein FRC18_011226 [Serendipita sp. 400]KAG8847787.1 hypothetical protein FRB91_011420 [Serendipita sp. 411]
MSVEEIKYQMEQQKKKFEAFEAGQKKVFEDRMSGYRIALQFEARRIAKARELEERASRRNQVEDDEIEDVEPSAWREEGEEEEAPQLTPAEDAETAESTVYKLPEDRATRSENESVPQQTRDLEPSEKGPRPPRTVYISEQEKDHLQSRFGHTVCDNCATAQYPCGWLFTGSLWACKQCYIRKTRCTVNRVGIWDRRDQWIAAIRNEGGALAIRNERGSSEDAGETTEKVVIVTPKKRNKPAKETGNNEAPHSLGSITLHQRIAEMLDLNNKLLKRLVNLGEENNRIIRTHYKHKDPNGSGGGHLGISEIGVSRPMRPVELDFLGDNEF